LNIDDQEVLKLRALLESYKQQHGTIAIGFAESTNTVLPGCATCSGQCCNSCTTTCVSYCDGNSGYCWAHWHGN
jgi:hypothetical protein